MKMMSVDLSTTETTQTESVSTRVVSAIADAKGVDPLDLPPLFEDIDPDALDSLFEATATSPRTEGRLTFTIDGYEVVVYSDETVTVTHVDEGSPSDHALALAK